MKQTIALIFVSLLTLAFAACATGAGDEVDCPECDNVTELLVGTKCVSIEEVEPCGPDGHLHGEECHCFSGQDPTEIGGVAYCLQADCAEHEVDLDAAACEELGEEAESVTAAAAFDDFDSVHLDKYVPMEVSLPAEGPGYAHFAGSETGEVAVYVEQAQAISGFFDGQGEAMEATLVGANPDCPDSVLEVWHVEVVNDTGSPVPVVIEFAPSLAKPWLVIYDMEDDGHEH